MKNLIVQRNALAAAMVALHETSKTEERGFSGDEKQKWDGMKADLSDLDERIERSKEAETLTPIVEPRSELPRPLIVDNSKNEDSNEASEEGDYSEAFDGFMRRGLADLSQEQRGLMQSRYDARAQSLTNAAGGYTVPEGFSGRIIEAMKQYGGLENFATVMTTATGNDLPFPTNDDTANVGELLAENAATAEQDTVFGQKMLSAYMYSSKMIRVSLQLLQDNEVSLESYLVNILGKRLGRIQATHFATGTGTGQPNGILTATTGITAAAASVIALEDLTKLEHGVDPSYRANGQASFLFNDATFKALKDLEDADGRPLWRPSMGADVPATINGYRFGIDQGYESIATGNKIATFGDHSAYTIRRVNGVTMSRLSERYAEYFQVAFLGFNRADGELLDASAVKHLVMA